MYKVGIEVPSAYPSTGHSVKWLEAEDAATLICQLRSDGLTHFTRHRRCMLLGDSASDGDLAPIEDLTVSDLEWATGTDPRWARHLLCLKRVT